MIGNVISNKLVPSEVLLDINRDMIPSVKLVLDLFNNNKRDFEEFNSSIIGLERSIFESDMPNYSPDGSVVSSRERVLLCEAYSQWETELEARFSNKLSDPSFISCYPLYQRFERLIARELKLLNVQKMRSLLFIGSGQFPISALMYQKAMGCCVTCLDHNPDAIDSSRNLLRRLNLHHGMDVVCGAGEEWDPSSYDGIVVAALALPKKAILSQISSRMRPDTDLICRTTTGLRQLLYKPLILDEDGCDFGIAHFAPAEADDTISSVLLKKKGV